MCGIAGIARASGAPVERETLEGMCAAQAHRGPGRLAGCISTMGSGSASSACA